MKLLASDTSDWADLDAEDGAEYRPLLDATLRRLLGTERLVVLTGLGTSRCIVNAAGDKPAPTMADLWGTAKAAVGDDAWSDALTAAGWSAELPDDIELLLSRCQMALALGRNEGLDAFVSACESEIVKACSFVEPDIPLPHHETFLRRVARRPSRLPRAQLFTTNYDLAFETAASRTGFAVIDGFSHAAPQRFDGSYFDVDFAVRDRERAASAVEWMPNVVHLLKLHGSVDWSAQGNQVFRSDNIERPLIVYPRSTKFEVSYQQPFLELMGRFQSALRRPDSALVVIGSGLSDRHLAEPILAAVRSNPRIAVLVCAPDLSNADREHAVALANLIRAGDRRVSLLEATFEDLTRVLPDPMPLGEAEMHAERVGH